jgi:NAD(P)-dependent dehydrogenase (short-subunit alcohol dehydrogenase family)
MGKLDGKIALVTGGNSGIGLATAKLFVKEGTYVFITGRCEAELSAASKEIGRNVTSVQGDVSKLDDLDRLFAQIKQQKGKLDVVFANAGIAQFAPHISRRCQPAIPVVAVHPVPLKIIPNLENRFVVSPAIQADEVGL